MPPHVSVLVPTIGRLEFLDDAMASVRDQTLRDFEVIVLDNASPPDAQQALAHWARLDTRLRIVRSDTRLPMFENFNRGLDLATGRYLCFFHDDDVYLPRYLEALSAGLDAHPRAAIAGGNPLLMNRQGRLLRHRRWIRSTHVLDGHAYIEQLMHRGRNVTAMPGLMFRRGATGRFNEGLSIHFGDYVFLMRIAEQHDLFLCEESLVRVRRHHEQASMSIAFSDAVPIRTRVLLEFCDEYLARHPEEAKLVAGWRDRVQLLHRVALTWGWATAESSEEAERCTHRLGPSLADRATGQLLRAVARTPLRTALDGALWRTAARNLGRTLGF